MLTSIYKKIAYALATILLFVTSAFANGNIVISTECGTMGSYPAIAIKVDNNSTYTFDYFSVGVEVFDKGGNFLEEKTLFLSNLRPRRHGIDQATLTKSKGVLCNEIGSLEFFLSDAIIVEGIRPYGKLDPNPEMTNEIEGLLKYKSLDPASFYIVKASTIPHGS